MNIPGPRYSDRLLDLLVRIARLQPPVPKPRYLDLDLLLALIARIAGSSPRYPPKVVLRPLSVAFKIGNKCLNAVWGLAVGSVFTLEHIE